MLNPCVLPTVHEQHEIYHKANQHRAMLLIANGFQHTSLWSNQTWSPFYTENLVSYQSCVISVLLLRTFWRTEG